MTMLTITTSRLASTDLVEAGEVLDAAFERTGMLPGLRLAFALQPESWLCARRDGQIVAVVGAYDYGPVASIGMMAVAPLAQRQGVGERLMAELAAYLEARGCPLLFLDASAAGQYLYPKLGFVPEGETLRMVRMEVGRSLGEPAVPGAEGLSSDGSIEKPVVKRLEERDLAEVAVFDAPIFGADRLAVIQTFWAGSPERAFVARDVSGSIAGYLIAGANHIGPWVAVSVAAATSLLAAVLALSFDRPPSLTCPAANPEAIALLRCQGFTPSERLLHMQRGGARDPRRTDCLYAQASLTLG